ncbi:hypothetical protein, partial [Pseudoalteromonas rubra]|uniref:hypothetical protein n=1 Tax=Pseudoalteromonas rubra TaxID=43658 RepID=UPI000AF7F379
NQSDVDTALASKANQSDVTTALATKANQSDVDTALASKANQSDVTTALAAKANQSDVDTALASKANQSDVTAALATKANQSDVDTALASKANQSDVTTALAAKANQSDVDTALASKANQSNVDIALASKANQSDVDTALAAKANQSDVDTALAAKANQSDVDIALASKANQSDVTTALAAKANQSDVDTALASKANQSEVNTALADKANKSDVNTALASKADQVDMLTALASTLKFTPAKLAWSSEHAYQTGEVARVAFSNSLYIATQDIAATSSEKSPILDVERWSLLLKGASSVVKNVMFVTSTEHTGNLGGANGADNICNSLANSAGSKVPSGTYKALLDTSSYKVDSSETAYNINGDVVANTGSDLWRTNTTPLQVGIVYDEKGNDVTGARVWTNMNYRGSSVNWNTCSNWTSSSANDPYSFGGAMTGIAGETSTEWVQSSTLSCGSKARLYCVKQ